MTIIRIGPTSKRYLLGMPKTMQQNSSTTSKGRLDSFCTSTIAGYEMKSTMVNISQHMGADTEMVPDREKSIRSGTKVD